MENLNDKVVVVTGASEGIGRALSIKFAEHKAKVVLSARNEKRLNGLKNQIESSGGTALVVPTDVTDINSCENLIRTTINLYGRIDILVNNAGRTMWADFEEIKEISIFKNLMELNYLGSVYCHTMHFHILKRQKVK